MRDRLIDPRYWSFWWRVRVPARVKLVLSVTLALAAVVAYIAAQQPPSVPAAAPLPAAPTPAPPTLATVQEELSEAQLFELWSRANPGDRERYEQYVEALRLGLQPEPPEMVTPLGRALVAAFAAAAPDSG